MDGVEECSKVGAAALQLSHYRAQCVVEKRVASGVDTGDAKLFLKGKEKAKVYCERYREK